MGKSIFKVLSGLFPDRGGALPANNNSQSNLLKLIKSVSESSGPVQIPTNDISEFIVEMDGLDNHQVQAVGVWASELNFKSLDQTINQTKLVGAKGKQFLIETHQEAFKNRMSFLTKDEQKAILDEMVSAAGRSQITAINLEEGAKGIIVTEDIVFKDLPLILVSWVWIAEGLSSLEARGVRNQIVQIMKDSKNKDSKNKDIVARVDLRNKRSLRFFANLGFKVKWLF
jgi:hypothetical protein